MAKKRKLNSKNPKYSTVNRIDGLKVKEKKLMCDIPVRNINGDLIKGTTIPVYGVWHED